MDNDENYYDYHGYLESLEEEGLFLCGECEEVFPLDEEHNGSCKECYALSSLIARNNKRLAGLK